MTTSSCRHLASDYIESWSRLAGRRGGDFIVHRVDRDLVTVVLGDVCGHGEAAADVADDVRAMVARELDGVVSDDLLRRWHRQVFARHGDENLFVCITILQLNLRTQKLRIVNCGNPDLIVHREDGQRLDRFVSTGMPLGIVEEKDWSPPSFQWTYLDQRDYAMGISDGVVDYQRADSERFGLARICAALRSSTACNSPLDEVRRRLLGFGPARGECDDLSMFVLRGARKRVA